VAAQTFHAIYSLSSDIFTDKSMMICRRLHFNAINQKGKRSGVKFSKLWNPKSIYILSFKVHMGKDKVDNTPASMKVITDLIRQNDLLNISDQLYMEN